MRALGQKTTLPDTDLTDLLACRVAFDLGPTQVGPERYVAGYLETARRVDGRWFIRLSVPDTGDRWFDLDAAADEITVERTA
jgi:hypothetical protein